MVELNEKAEEVMFCPQCGWNSAMDGEALPAHGDGLVVGWAYDLATNISYEDGKPHYGGWEARISFNEPNVPEGSIRNLRALREAATALSSGVRVKGLEWMFTASLNKWRGWGAFGEFTSISATNRTDEQVEAAKAEADREYAASVLSALSDAPVVTEDKQVQKLTTENERLREALNLIDALDPEEHIYGVSHDACRGLIIRMGEAARAALDFKEDKK